MVGGGGVEKWRLKLTSAKVEVEVEAELGKNSMYKKSWVQKILGQKNWGVQKMLGQENLITQKLGPKNF